MADDAVFKTLNPSSRWLSGPGKNWEEKLIAEARKIGAREASLGRPHSDTPPFDIPESELRARIEVILMGYQKMLTNELLKITPTKSRLQGETGEVRQKIEQRKTPDTIRNYIDGALENARGSLTSSYTNKYEAEGYYNGYRYIHNINIEPDHPTDQLNYLSVILLICLGEGVLNTVFWTQQARGFITTGLLMAFGVAAINIAIGFLAGIGFSYKNMSSILHKALGWGSLLIGISLAVALNLYIVSNRLNSAGGLTPEQLNFNDNFSKVMFALGVIFSLISLYKGYRFFGSIPGYKDASKRYMNCVSEVNKHRNELISVVRIEVETEITACNQLLRQANDIASGLRKLESSLKDIQGQFRLHVSHLLQVLKGSVFAYRKANTASRANNIAPPEWFKDEVVLDVPINSNVQEFSEDLQITLLDARQLIEGVSETFRTETAELRTMLGQYMGNNIPALVSECDNNGRIAFVNRVGNIQ